MNILILDYKSFGIEDLKEALKRMGHSYKLISDPAIRDRVDEGFKSRFLTECEKSHYDCAFSFNYSPLISNCCNLINLPYVCLIYDSPQINTFSYTIINPCNHIYTFDSADYFRFADQGIKSIHYMPLPVNVHRLDKQLGSPYDKTSESTTNITHPNYSADISFIGSMYNEKHNLYDRLVKAGINDYTRGYLEAIMDAQEKVYGSFYLEDLITGPILEEMLDKMEVKANPDGVETVSYVYANYFLCRKLANKERTHILQALDRSLAKNYKVSLYTHNPVDFLENVHTFGPVDYYDHMPHIFRQTKINLNISLRSIRSGIPLRCMDILASKGFLMSNYQEDFLRHFVDGEDLCLYDSKEDLLRKCNYYLEHEDKREAMALSAYEKVKENHSYEKILNLILSDL